MWRIGLVGSVIAGLAGCAEIPPGQVVGTPNLYPAGCTTPGDGTCRVSNEVQYRPNQPGALLWQSEPYEGRDLEPIGTTDGASIPQVMWSVIGTPYSPEFIRPAILHDHYTWPENRIRPWRDTHRTFLYALLDEGVDPVRAYLMYYAVYVFGGHWATLEVPEDDEECDYCLLLAGYDGVEINELQTLQGSRATADLPEVWAILSDPRNGLARADLETSIQFIEDLAAERHPENFFLTNGDIIELTLEIAQCIELPEVEPHAIEGLVRP
jgi:hypothetical protein